MQATEAPKPPGAGAPVLKEASLAAPRRSMAQRLGIGGLLSILVGSFIVVFGAVAAYIALSNLYREKTADVWAILYMETEREVRLIERKLSQAGFADGAAPLTAAALAANPPSAVVTVNRSDGKDAYDLTSGWLGRRAKLESLDFLAGHGRTLRFNVSMHSGKPYFVRRQVGPAGSHQNLIYLWSLDAEAWFGGLARAQDGLIVYIASREGQLVFTSDKRVTPASLGRRSLIREFVQAPLSRGQLEIETEEAGKAYGMFHQIGDSNLVLFEEVPKAVIMDPVESMAISFTATMVVVLVLGLLAIQLPMGRLVRPLRQLAVMAEAIGQGNLAAKPIGASFGEVKILAQTFRSMVDGLVRRDAAIASFIEEQKESVRLQAELKVAQGIQDALLPKGVDLDGAGVVLATHYSPAAECAGDWYSYCYDATTGELIIAIADVSGHGAGAAMYTAVIAGLFEETRIRQKGSFDSADYFRRLNQVMIRMGGRNWHSTFTILRYERGNDYVELSNAGGTPPYLVDHRSGQPKAKLEQVPSDLIGLADDPVFGTKQIPLPPGTCMFLYTDGLTEARGDDESMYGRKKLRRCLEGGALLAPSAMINRVLGDWNAHRGSKAPDDDVCLIAIRRA